MSRNCVTFVFAAVLLALTASAGAAPDPGAFVVMTTPSLCQANLTPAQQAPSKLLGAPAPKPQTCFQDCLWYARLCQEACNGDEQCLSDCGDQFEYCRCGCGDCH